MIPAPHNLLQVTQPSWFKIRSIAGSTIDGVAKVPETIWAEIGVALTIEVARNVAVREQVPGTLFPSRCPERHIQRDRTFCLGLRRAEISSEQQAYEWWESLRFFLICQSTAEETRTWPSAYALDHGDAGIYHERALELALELNIEKEYAAAHSNEKSWITDKSLKLLNRRDEPINGRSPCPRGCTYRHRPNNLIIRRNCHRRNLLLQLVIAERERRKNLAEYWQLAKQKNETCCGRMRNCELSAMSQRRPKPDE